MVVKTSIVFGWDQKPQIFFGSTDLIGQTQSINVEFITLLKNEVTKTKKTSTNIRVDTGIEPATFMSLPTSAQTPNG